MTHLVLKREPRILVIGSLLIIVGGALLLDRLDLLSLRWDKLFWIAGLLLGGFLVGDGFARTRRGRVFWGGVVFFTSLYAVLLRLGTIDRYDYPLVPVLFVVFGLAFLLLYLTDLRETTLLLPALLFGGTGMLAMLWWWEVYEWDQLSEAISTYWPVLVILWGLTIILRRRPSSAAD